MTELEKNIKILLWENDCVIVPHIGAFISYNIPAQYICEENLFLPPARTIGFNPDIKINDGLLIQSYMSRHHLNYADAARRVDADATKVYDELNRTGITVLDEIGTLTLHNNHIVFAPVKNGITSPSLYGLDALTISPAKKEEKEKNNTIYIPIGRSLLQKTASIAAAVVLLMVFATPISNERNGERLRATLGSFATGEQLYCMELISASASHSPSNHIGDVSIVPVNSVNKPIFIENNVPVSEATDNRSIVDVQAKVETAKKSSEAALLETNRSEEQKPAIVEQKSMYHIIISSLIDEKGANETINTFARKGYDGCSIVHSDRRYRISIFATDDLSQAQNRLAELRNDSLLKDAWILAVDGQSGKAKAIH